MIQNRFAAEQHRRMMSRIPAALVNGTILLLATILYAIYSFDRRPEYLLLGLVFTARGFGLTALWLASDTFLWTMR